MPKRQRPFLTPEVILDVEDAAVQVSFDNRPVTPPAASTPDQVLDLPRPVTTAYLLSLTRPPSEVWGKEKAGKNAPVALRIPEEAWEVVQASSITQMEIGLEAGE